MGAKSRPGNNKAPSVPTNPSGSSQTPLFIGSISGRAPVVFMFLGVLLRVVFLLFVSDLVGEKMRPFADGARIVFFCCCQTEATRMPLKCALAVYGAGTAQRFHRARLRNQECLSIERPKAGTGQKHAPEVMLLPPPPPSSSESV